MAHFKTAYGQREIILDATVAVDMNVGDLVKVTFDASGYAAVAKATGLSDATHIIAQSDMTMIHNKAVPVEHRDYKYNPKVAASTTAKKKVAVFAIIDKNDVIV